MKLTCPITGRTSHLVVEVYGAFTQLLVLLPVPRLFARLAKMAMPRILQAAVRAYEQRRANWWFTQDMVQKKRKLASKSTRCLCSGCSQLTTYSKKTALIASHRRASRNSKCERSGRPVTNEEILGGWYRKDDLARPHRPKGTPGVSESVRTVSGGLPGSRKGH